MQCLENRVAVREETGGHHVAGGSVGSPTPSEALKAIAPFGEWCVQIFKITEMSGLQRGKLDRG